jgi:thiosulfate/3-mercaptopyruvate sulfurtransferase
MPDTTLVSARALRDHLADPEWVVFDLRHDLSDSSFGEAAYQAGHIPGARFLHLDRDLSGAKTGANGRHPLPDPESFANLLSRHGVGPKSQIVAYDAHGGMFASRLWWMARWIGHEAAAVLDGGLLAWLREGGELSNRPVSEHRAVSLSVGKPLVRTVTADDLLANLRTNVLQIVDARSPDRYRGENETLDPVGGHIPGASNRFFKDNLEEDGRFKSVEQLRKEWQERLGDLPADRVVSQCGSGVTACHNLLSLEVAGLPGAALYPGSWSEWCSDPRRPVEGE